MADQKHNIQCIVEHTFQVSNEHSKVTVVNKSKNFLKKLLIFFGIIGMTAAIGYFAVYLPDSVPKQKEASGIEGIKGVPSEINNLSDEQKRKLKEYMGK